ncbi:MAG: alpha/beta fold hydrolase [Kiloniellaceae bacterium]
MQLVVDGRAVFAATGGRPFDPEPPAVVFLHGAGMDHTIWALQARYFAHHGRTALAVDLPGHGRSEGPGLDGIAAMAGWLVRLLDAAGLREAALAGHSMGALVALAAAAALGARVRALALLGGAPRMPVHPDLLAAAQAGDRLAFDLVTSWGHGPAGHLGGNRAPGLWLMGGAERLLERGAPGVLYRDLAACDAYADAAEAAARVACPCLLVLGAEDRMTPARAGQKLAEMIPGARVTMIPACGHMMMLEKPDRTLDALKTIL